MWFQVQYPPLTGVLPIFRSRYSFTIGRQRVFSLGRWTSRIQTRFHVTGFTRGLTRSRFAFAYGTVTRCGRAFHHVLLANRFVTPYWWPHNPADPKTRGLGCFLFARRYWGNRNFSLLSYGYLDVSVHRVSLVHLWIGCTIIQGSRDQRLFDGFPELIAAFHALHRLLTPRHPPHALSSLTTMILASRTEPFFTFPFLGSRRLPCPRHSKTAPLQTAGR